MKRLRVWLLAAAGAVVWWWTLGAADARTQETMRRKLEHAQQVLEGIALEDFERIARNAAKLKALSQSAGWAVRRTAEYQRLTGEFARQAGALTAAAERRNVEAATLAYFQLTASCVACHRQLRGREQARLDSPPENSTARP